MLASKEENAKQRLPAKIQVKEAESRSIRQAASDVRSTIYVLLPFPVDIAAELQKKTARFLMKSTASP